MFMLVITWGYNYPETNGFPVLITSLLNMSAEEDGGEANLISYNSAISACGKGIWVATSAVAGPEGPSG